VTRTFALTVRARTPGPVTRNRTVTRRPILPVIRTRIRTVRCAPTANGGDVAAPVPPPVARIRSVPVGAVPELRTRTRNVTVRPRTARAGAPSTRSTASRGAQAAVSPVPASPPPSIGPPAVVPDPSGAADPPHATPAAVAAGAPTHSIPAAAARSPAYRVHDRAITAA